MLRHLYGYNDIADPMFEGYFSYYVIIGCRHEAACITPSSKKNNDLPYYRDYSEACQTRIYLKGFSYQEMRDYVSSYARDQKCVGCGNSNLRRLVKCRSF